MKVALFVNADQLYETATEYLHQPLKLDYPEMYKNFLCEGDTLGRYYTCCSDYDKMAPTADPLPTPEEEKHFKALLRKFEHMLDESPIEEYVAPSEPMNHLIDVNYIHKGREGKYMVEGLSRALLHAAIDSDTKEGSGCDEKYRYQKIIVFMTGSPNVRIMKQIRKIADDCNDFTITLLTVKDTAKNLTKGLISRAHSYIELDESFFERYWDGEYKSCISNKKPQFVDVKKN